MFNLSKRWLTFRAKRGDERAMYELCRNSVYACAHDPAYIEAMRAFDPANAWTPTPILRNRKVHEMEVELGRVACPYCQPASV